MTCGFRQERDMSCDMFSVGYWRTDDETAVILAVWLSGNTLASINVVALRQTRLVLGWVTVCGRV